MYDFHYHLRWDWSPQITKHGVNEDLKFICEFPVFRASSSADCKIRRPVIEERLIKKDKKRKTSDTPKSRTKKNSDVGMESTEIQVPHIFTFTLCELPVTLWKLKFCNAAYELMSCFALLLCYCKRLLWWGVVRRDRTRRYVTHHAVVVRCSDEGEGREALDLDWWMSQSRIQASS